MPLPQDNYIITRDTSEAERLRIQHEMMLSCQGYYLHPDISLPSTGARIADVCTGSGIFILDIAQAQPNAECHGFDISDTMFPAPSELPSNVEFHVADIRQPFESRWVGYFDAVHVRLVECAMTKGTWAPALQNLTTLLKPGGWLQWVEDDRAVSVRHAARPIAPAGAAKESLLASGAGEGQFTPPKIGHLDRINRVMMPNARSDDMMYGYMNLDSLMKDPSIGNLDSVGCDLYVIDREDDGGQLRRNWAAMGIGALRSMLKSRREAGDPVIGVDEDELAQGFSEDIAKGGHFITRASVFTGRKKA